MKLGSSKLPVFLLASPVLFAGPAFAEDAHGGGSAFPPFDTTTFASTLFWLVITFSVLYWLMSRVALPRVSGIIEDRNATIARDLDQAAALQKNAEDAGTAYEAALAKAKANAVAIGQQAKDEATAAATTSRKSVEAEVSAKIAAAEATIAATKLAAMGNVSSIATDTAAAIVERISGVAPAKADIAKAIAAVVKS